MTQENEHPTPDAPVKCAVCGRRADSPTQWFNFKLCSVCHKQTEAQAKQAAGMKQAQDLAVEGWASTPGVPLHTKVWMVRKDTMKDWRGLASTIKNQLAGIVRDQLSLGADHRVGVALEKIEVLLGQLPSGEPCEVCRGKGTYGFNECGTCKAKEERCSLK